MSWIRIVSEREATGLVKDIYDDVLTKTKRSVGEILSCFSLRPDLLQARTAFSQYVYASSGLGRYKEELIATSISAALNCKY